jgi:hypothetical protein
MANHARQRGVVGLLALAMRELPLIKWIRKKFIREGKLLIRWPAKDLREDTLVVDISRIDDDIIGVKRRRYGVLRHASPIPEFSEQVEYINFDEL